MSLWDKNKTKTQTSRAGGKAGEAVLPSPADAAGSELAEQRDEQSNPAGRDVNPDSPGSQPYLLASGSEAQEKEPAA